MADRMAAALEILKAMSTVLRIPLPFTADWDTVKLQIQSLNSAAIIATFLAAVQSQIIAISYQDNSTRVKVATNVLGFAGVLLDVIAACFSLLASAVLQRNITIIESYLGAVEDASLQHTTEIQNAFDALPQFMVPSDLRQRVRHRLDELQNQPAPADAGASTRPRRLVRLLNRNTVSLAVSFSAIYGVSSMGDAAGTAMLLGIVSFFASVLCLAISTQPQVVWIVSAVVCLYGVSLPLQNLVLAVFMQLFHGIILNWLHGIIYGTTSSSHELATPARGQATSISRV
ncbi:hypothetical protein DFH09DRAFT_1153665 [Mycena vulgaris]|nr:hypothetical protein DFH09DRAFT_1153665 [Mycena vulgaris]